MTYEERLEQFKALVAAHDLTYDFSDDHREWKRGHQSYRAILEAADGLPWDVVVTIWNENVDRRLTGGRESFYWSKRAA